MIMKLLISLIIALVSFTSVPAFACGPMGNGGTNNMSPGREKWTRNRMGQLKARRQAQKGEGATNMGTDVASRMQQMNDTFATTVNDNLRNAQKGQREIDT